MRVKLVQRVVSWVKSEQARLWLGRLVMPALAIVMFVALTHTYNVWDGLTLYNLFRRTIAAFALGAIVFGPAVVMRTKVQAIYLGVASLVVGLLFLANAIYSAYAGGFLSASSLSYFWQASDTTGSIVQLFKPRMFVFFAPGVLFLFVASFYRRWRLQQWGRLGRVATIVIISLSLLTGLLGYGFVAYREINEYGNLRRFTEMKFDSKELVRKIGVINYNLVDLVNYLQRKHSLSPAETKYVEQNRATQVTPSGPNDATGWLAGRSIVYLQLESFQQFLIGLKVNGQEVTPNLNKLATQSRQFTNFNYDIGPGTSSDAEFVTFNSLMPLANRSVVFDYPANDYKAYPQKLKEQGYATLAYHADSRNFWNRANTFPVFGFEQYLAEESYKKGEVIGFGLDDKDFLTQTADKLSGVKQPFYAHVITLSSHTPFKLPANERKLDLSGVTISELQSDYLQAAHYTDGAIGVFMDELKKKGLSDKVALVMMGDHEGFIFGDKDNNFAKFLGYGDSFNDLTSQQARRIPFMIYAPGTPLTPGVDDRQVSQLDVYPTLLNLLAIKKPDTVMGVDLFGSQTPTVVKRLRGAGPSIDVARKGDLTYVARSVADDKPACYRGEHKVDNAACDDLRDFAVARAITSDYVITGNEVQLLSASK